MARSDTVSRPVPLAERVDGADAAEDDGVVSGGLLVVNVADEHGEGVGQHRDAVVRRQCSHARRSGRPAAANRTRELAVLVPEDVHREGATLTRRRPCS